MVILLALLSSLPWAAADDLAATPLGLTIPSSLMLPPMFIRLAWPAVKARAVPPLPGDEVPQLIGGLLRRSEAEVPAPNPSPDPLRRLRSREIPFVDDASGPEYEEETR